MAVNGRPWPVLPWWQRPACSSGWAATLALTQEARIALLVLVGACVLFFTELIPLGVSALLIPVVLCLTGVLTEAEAFASLCDDTILMFAHVCGGQAMFAIGVARLGAWIARWSGTDGLSPDLGHGRGHGAALLCAESNTGTVAVCCPSAWGGWQRAPAYRRSGCCLPWPTPAA